MTRLVEGPTYLSNHRDRFLNEFVRINLHHLQGCEIFRKIWAHSAEFDRIEDAPFLHVGLFKQITLETGGEGVVHERSLLSSSTTGNRPSRIRLDRLSSELQSLSTYKILAEYLGERRRPLLVLDSAGSLRTRGEISARIAAAMSLRPFASEMRFLLEDAEDPKSIDLGVLEKALEEHDDLIIYGFTWALWEGWRAANLGERHQGALVDKTICFVHSGGWKRLDSIKVDQGTFDAALVSGLGRESKIVDFYGLVEQVGIIYPLCENGYRHVPAWADVLVRSPQTLGIEEERPGMLQLLNVITFGAPCHSVLTEDMGRIVPGQCPCGRRGKRFELIGRIAKSEIRGCGNV